MDIDNLPLDVLRGLAKQEREMDAGTQPFVRDEGGRRWSVTPEVMEQLGLVSGQTASHALITGILKATIASLEEQIKNQPN